MFISTLHGNGRREKCVWMPPLFSAVCDWMFVLLGCRTQLHFSVSPQIYIHQPTENTSWSAQKRRAGVEFCGRLSRSNQAPRLLRGHPAKRSIQGHAIYIVCLTFTCSHCVRVCVCVCVCVCFCKYKHAPTCSYLPFWYVCVSVAGKWQKWPCHI